MQSPFPTLPDVSGARSEEAIERQVESLMDSADHIFMSMRGTQDEYDAWCKALHRWANACLRLTFDRA